MHKLYLFIFVLHTILLDATPLEYLNTLRTATGLAPLTQESHLQTSAQNHSNYMQKNNVAGHEEISSNDGYTGATLSERTQYAKYSSLYVGENISAGTTTYEASIDGLFSAIYHRFGFLNLSYDLIGIGENSIFYTYDLGNSQHMLLCEGESYTGSGSYYTNACIDHSKHISVTDYTNASNAFKSTSPSLVLWPAHNAGGIPPVFYEESPDPLPDDSVTGYPISVEFNDQKFSSPPVVTQFLLKDETNTTLNLLSTMQNNNDPAGKFTTFQTAIFPEKRLEWGSVYYPILSYDFNGISTTKSWCFSTKSLISEATHFYRVENNNNISYNVRTGESYAIYVVPSNTNDKINSVNYSYNVSNVSFSYIDNNTVKITLDGSLGSYAEFTFNNGQKITLTIQNNDTSTTPKNDLCPLIFTDMYTLTTQLSTDNITTTSTAMNIILTINKANTIPNSETLAISFPKNNNLTLNFDPNLQMLEGTTLSNDNWSYSQTLTQHKLTYIPNDGIFPDNTMEKIGIESIFTPPLDKKGFFTFYATTTYRSKNTEDINKSVHYSNLPN